VFVNKQLYNFTTRVSVFSKQARLYCTLSEVSIIQGPSKHPLLTPIVYLFHHVNMPPQRTVISETLSNARLRRETSPYTRGNIVGEFVQGATR
jgi:hypothetical protein